MAKAKSVKPTDTAANLGFDAKRRFAANTLRNNFDAAEFKHVALDPIFPKCISDAFEEHQARLVEGQGEYDGIYPEDPMQNLISFEPQTFSLAQLAKFSLLA